MEEAQGLSAVFPNPPPFWQEFTNENVERIAELRSQKASSDKEQNDPTKQLPIRILDLPAELRFLQPPALPAEATYRMFGDTYNLEDPLPALEDWGVQSLYKLQEPTPTDNGKYDDHAFILKKMAKSLLLNFLELVGIMSYSPIDFQEKIDDLRTIFVNFHHLLNTYRPHQARESLILLMQAQLEQSRKETQGIKDMKAKVEGIIHGLGQTSQAEVDEPMILDEKGGDLEEGKDVWDELEKHFA